MTPIFVFWILVLSAALYAVMTWVKWPTANKVLTTIILTGIVLRSVRFFDMVGAFGAIHFGVTVK